MQVDWTVTWNELNAAYAGIETIGLTGRFGGADAATNDLKAFFDASISLGERAFLSLGRNVQTDLPAWARSLSQPWIRICRDLAIEFKHGRRSKGDWAGDPDLRVERLPDFHRQAPFNPAQRRMNTTQIPGTIAASPIDPPWKVVYRWNLIYKNQPIAATDLCRRTIAQWTEELPKLGLAFPAN